MNIIDTNSDNKNTLYDKSLHYVMYWKTPTFNINDSHGNPFPEPSENMPWSGRNFFINKLKQLESTLLKNFDDNTFIDITHINCLLCTEKNISHYSYVYKNFVWSESLMHYISVHNVKPPSSFIRFVLNNDPITHLQLRGTYHVNGKCAYVKIHANQFLIIDALLEHGGKIKKYKEKHESAFRYSEHAGMLDIDLDGVKYIIVSSKTSRMSHVDKSIFLPQMGEISKDIKYIFHTHPPTPTIGGRVEMGILYEYPSASDIVHFVEHFNHSDLQGSIVLTAEGLYNIRKYEFNKKHISLPQKFVREYRKRVAQCQDIAILKYGEEFSDEKFLSIIAQDTTGIDDINALLKDYDLCIDFFPRQKNTVGQWIIGTIYLPVCAAQQT
jgi:hypothetical protein